MRVLVTGGAGYIGSVLVPSLIRQGYEVVVLDDLRLGGHGLLGVYGHPRFKFVKGDICDKEVVEQAIEGCTTIVHLAALVGEPPCSKWPEEAARVNYDGTVNMLDAAHDSSDVRQFIFSSTCSNYGKQSGKDLDEESDLVPLSLYAETKIEAESIVLDGGREWFSTTVLRFGTAYGISPRMRFDTLLNELVRDAVVDGWLLVYGRESYRTLAHVGDITQMVSLVIAKRDEATGRVFNVGGGHITKVGLARLIQQYVPDVEIEYKDQKADPRDYRASYDRALSFGFKPQYTVRDGVAEVSSALKNGLFSDPHSSLYRNVQ